MSRKNDLHPVGHFEKAPDAQGEFRVVTAHEYPWGLLMGVLGVKPLTEKWEQGTVSRLESISNRLRNATPGPVEHPVMIRYVEDMAEWEREQGRTLASAVKDIRAQLDREYEAAHPPVASWEDPVV